MSNHSSGCLTSLFRCCKSKSHRNAISADNHASLHNSQEIISQNPSIQTTHSLPQNLRASTQSLADLSKPVSHKPSIAVKKGDAFEPQALDRSEVISKNNWMKTFDLRSSVSSLPSDFNESIHESANNTNLLSTQTFRQIFNSTEEISWRKTFSKINPLPNPFVFDTKQMKPKLVPITPAQFTRRRTVAVKDIGNNLESSRKVRRSTLKTASSRDMPKINKRYTVIKENDENLYEKFDNSSQVIGKVHI